MKHSCKSHQAMKHKGAPHNHRNKNTPNSGFNFNLNNFYEDWDHDGVMNGIDCFPLDKHRQDVFPTINKTNAYFKSPGISSPMQNMSMAPKPMAITITPTPKVNVIPQTPLSNAVAAVTNFYQSKPIQQLARDVTTVRPEIKAAVNTVASTAYNVASNTGKWLAGNVFPQPTAYYRSVPYASQSTVAIPAGKNMVTSARIGSPEASQYALTSTSVRGPLTAYVPTTSEKMIKERASEIKQEFKQPVTTSFPSSPELRFRGEPNFDKIPVGDIKGSGYNNLSEMKAEYKNNPEKFYAKTGFGSKDQYGNVSRTDADFKTITTFKTPGTGRQPGGGFDYGGEGYIMNIPLVLTRTPTGTYVNQRPEGWGLSNSNKDKYPGLIDTNISETVLKTSPTLPTNAVSENMRVYAGKGVVINPYKPMGVNNKDYNIEFLPRPYGSSMTPTGITMPTMNSGYKLNTFSPFIPAESIRDQNMKTYVNREQSQILNPYYIPVNANTANQIIKEKIPLYWGQPEQALKNVELNPGYKPDYASPTIPRGALKNPLFEYGSGSNVVNPYYIADKNARANYPYK